MELGVAQLGLAEADAYRLRTIMGIAATNGELKHNWVMCNPSGADLIVLSADSVDRSGAPSANSASKRRVLAILAGETDEVPAGYQKLPWPIRLEHVVSLLRIVESKAERASRSPNAPSPKQPATGSNLIELATILRDASLSAPGAAFKVEGMAKDPLHIALGERVFYFDGSLVSLRGLAAGVRLKFIPVSIETTRALRGKRPIMMLEWLVGLETAVCGFLPWIDMRRAMQLRRYPPFQALLHTPAHRRIAAALARPRTSTEEIARLTAEDVPTITGFINAASLCGYLVPAGAASPRNSGASFADAAKRTLFKSFRKALGITSGNA